MKLTHALDIAGVLLVAGFTFFIWPPAPLLVIGGALLAASFMRARGGSR